MKRVLISVLCGLFIASASYAAERVVLVNGQGEEISNTDNELKVTGSGTAGTADAGVVTIQGIASGTAVSVSGAVTSVVTNAGTFAVQESHTTTTGTPVSAVTLDNDPVAYTSAEVNISGYQRVGFYWSYAETEVGGVAATLTLTASTTSGGTFMAVPFFDTAGGATPQTSEQLTSDGSYICWLDKNIPFGYIKVTITGNGVDVDDTCVNTVTMIYDK